MAERIKAEALHLGFCACGISRLAPMHKEQKYLEKWLANNYHASMSYMERNIDKRTNPLILVPGAKTVVSVLMNYKPAEKLSDDKEKISCYAYGLDYHDVVKDRLYQLLEILKKETALSVSRVFVDSAPVFDKAMAQQSGLGWIGKNTCLINRDFGSFTFIGEIITDADLPADQPFDKDFCGTCTKCIDACPTGALKEAYVLDANKCISYQTIENRAEILPSALDLNGWIYGCDICLDVCPWNKKTLSHSISEFELSEELSRDFEWESLTQEKFDALFRLSPVKRLGYKLLKRNIEKANSKLNSK